jgi:hypothetical protein
MLWLETLTKAPPQPVEDGNHRAPTSLVCLIWANPWYEQAWFIRYTLN